MSTFTATCHTEGCPNAGHAIELSYDPAGPPLDFIMCGVCGQDITDHTYPHMPTS